METYGNDCKIGPGIIQGDVYTFLTESKTALFVQEPSEQKPGRIGLFFLALSFAIGLGALMDGVHRVVLFPATLVGFCAAVSVTRSVRKSREPDEWKLFVGSNDNPFLIYSCTDATEFVAKRNEIEQALLGRPLSEEK